MGLVFRQTFKSTIFLGLGALLGGVLILLQANLMEKADYGFARLLTNQSVILSIIFGFGATNTLSVYIFKFSNDKKKLGSIFLLCLLIPLFILLLATIPFYLYRYELAAMFNRPEDGLMFLKYFWTFPVHIIGFLFLFAFEQILLANHKTAKSSLIKEVLLRLVNIFIVLAFYFQFINYTSFIWLWSINILFTTVFLVVISFKSSFIHFSNPLKHFNKQEFLEIFRFAGFHLLLNFSMTIISYFDSVLLAPLDPNGLNSVAVYTNAVFLVSLMAIPYRPMILATYPSLYKAYVEDNYESVRNIFNRSALNIQVVAILMTVLLIINAKEASMVLGKGNEVVATIAIILSIGRLGDMITGLNDNVLSISKFYHYFAYFTIGIFIILTICYVITIPKFGMWGAAWSTSIVLLLYNLIKTHLLYKKFKLMPFSIQTMKIFIIGFVCFLITYWIPSLNNIYFDITIKSTLAIVTYFYLILRFNPAPDVRTFIQPYINKYIYKIK